MWLKSNNNLEAHGASALKEMEEGASFKTLVFFGRLHGITSKRATSP
jgi:hypothetical protein